jgi:ribosomal protein S18 acetylase RimI-like enzyme
MDILVRAATEADIETLAVLNRVIQRLHAAIEPAHFKADIADQEVRAFFADRLRLARHRFAIAEVGGVPAGYIWFERQDHVPESVFALPRRRIFVNHIGVDAAFRRRGVASALLRHVEGEAAREGLERVALSVWAANEEAQSFFRAQGFAPLNLLLTKPVMKPP